MAVYRKLFEDGIFGRERQREDDGGRGRGDRGRRYDVHLQFADGRADKGKDRRRAVLRRGEYDRGRGAGRRKRGRERGRKTRRNARSRERRDPVSRRRGGRRRVPRRGTKARRRAGRTRRRAARRVRRGGAAQSVPADGGQDRQGSARAYQQGYRPRIAQREHSAREEEVGTCRDTVPSAGDRAGKTAQRNGKGKTRARARSRQEREDRSERTRISRETARTRQKASRETRTGNARKAGETRVAGGRRRRDRKGRPRRGRGSLSHAYDGGSQNLGRCDRWCDHGR